MSATRFLRWAQQAFNNFGWSRPAWASCIRSTSNIWPGRPVREIDGVRAAIPDTLVGTDSHTTMINGLGVLGWGVGGIEAEAVHARPAHLPADPRGGRGPASTDALPAGTTATDLVLTLTEMLRKHGVVDKFVEFCGPGFELDVRARPGHAVQYVAGVRCHGVAVSRRRPNAGYLRASGRDAEAHRPGRALRQGTGHVPHRRLGDADVQRDGRAGSGEHGAERRRAEAAAGSRCPARCLEVLHQRLGGAPRRDLGDRREDDEVTRLEEEGGIDPAAVVEEPDPQRPHPIPTWSATAPSSSRPSRRAPHVQPGCDGGCGTARAQRGRARSDAAGLREDSLAPGSRVVTDYLERAGLLGSLEQLRFNLVGYGCTPASATAGRCPRRLPSASSRDSPSRRCSAATATSRAAFIRRCVPRIWRLRRSWLPMRWPGGSTSTSPKTRSAPDKTGIPLFLSDIWPAPTRSPRRVRAALGSDLYTREYARIFDGDEHWQQLPSPSGALFDWDATSTYVREPRTSSACNPIQRLPRTSSMRACSRSSATRSPPTTSRRREHLGHEPRGCVPP